VSELADSLRRIASDLDEANVAFALIGGLAVSVRAEPRFTRDADLAVSVRTDADSEALVRHLLGRGYALESSVEQAATGRLATVRLTRSDSDDSPVVDLLFASSGIEPDLVARAEPLEILPDLTIPVALTGDLMALKVLARDDLERPQDVADLRALLRVASDSDLTQAQASLALIERRGYHRGRALVQAFLELRRP